MAGPTQPLDPWLVFRDDLAAYRHALQLKEVQDAFVYSNRFSSDAILFATPRDRSALAFFGLLLRIAAEDYSSVLNVTKSKGSKDPKLKTAGDPFEVTERFVAAVSEALANPSAEILDLSRAFFRFELDISQMERDRHEQAAYAASWVLGSKPRAQLSQFFLENLRLMSQPHGRLPETIGAEMARLSHISEFGEKDLCFYTAFRALGLAHEYILFELRNLADHLKKETVDWVEEFLPRFTHLLHSLDTESEESNWVETAAVVGDLVIKWRSDWLRYGQLVSMLGALPPDAPPEGSFSGRLRQRRLPTHE